MYHSITFGEKNTWDDWKLVPTSRPVFNPPELKRRTIEIPGADGFIDLSEALTGYPVYENREGSFEFTVLNGYKTWYDAFSDICDYLHGQQMKAILEDDKNYFYEGRFTVDEWKSNKGNSSITINYSVHPYKWSVKGSLDDEWEWDPFNFRTGVIFSAFYSKKAVPEQGLTLTYDNSLIGRAPVCPKFIISTSNRNGMTIQFENKDLKINKEVTANKDGIYQFPEIVFYGSSVKMHFSCHSSETGTVSIDFRQGRL